MRGCSTNEDKRCEIGSLFEDRKLDVLALSETKMKGKGESVFGAVKGRISGVMNGRAREGVGLLLSERLMACVVEWKEVSSRLMWVKVKFGCEVWMFISAYGPGSERSEDERTSFWNELSECVRIVKVRENVVVLGDLNARVGDLEIENVVGMHGVPGTNESGEQLVGMCMEHELVIGNTWFRKKDINKYTWIRVNDGRMVDRALMDYVIVNKSARGRLLDVHVLRGAAGGMSDHFLVEGRVKVSWKKWMRNERKQESGKVVKVSELKCEQKRNDFQNEIERRFECTEESGCVEEEWKNFKCAVIESAEEICGMRVIGKRAKKGSEWWNDEMKDAVEKKKRAFEVWLKCKTAEKYALYKEERKAVKLKVKIEKRKADERWGRKVSEKYETNKKIVLEGAERCA